MNQMVKNKNKDKDNSSNSLVFGRWLQTKIAQMAKFRHTSATPLPETLTLNSFRPNPPPPPRPRIPTESDEDVPNRQGNKINSRTEPPITETGCAIGVWAMLI